MIKYRKFFTLTNFAVALAIVVVMLGAYTRLTDAGLGCPDWPGCYGHLIAKQPSGEIIKKFPSTPFYAMKAWTEMVHRYLAGTLACMIAVLFLFSIRLRNEIQAPKVLPVLLVGTVIFQALLGMWTVTLKLLPQVVSLHLIGGFTTLALLWCLRLQLRQAYHSVIDNFAVSAKSYTILGFFMLVIQIMLGAWVSTNYAALSCGSDFPACNGLTHLPAPLSAVFAFSQPVGVDYSGGLLPIDVRMAIQMVHRYWALITAVYLWFLGFLFIIKSTQLRRVALLMIILLFVQVALGIANVTHMLPLPIAVLHNGVAAVLMLTLLTLVYATFQARSRLNV